MGNKGLQVLQAVLRAFGPSRVAYVVGAADQDVVKDYRDEIAALCRDCGIVYRDRGERAPATADCHFAISWRWMIRDATRLIVLHDSLLPKYRGFAPLPTALINGDSAVGVTALWAGEEYDRGGILSQRRLPVTYPVKIQEVISRLGGEYAALVLELCERLFSGAAVEAVPQDEAEATYSLWRDEADYRVDWSGEAGRIKRFIDSVGEPYKGAAALLEGRKVRVLDGEVEADIRIEDRHPGKVVFVRSGFPIVVCGRGLLRITDLRDDATGESLLPLKRFRTRFL